MKHKLIILLIIFLISLKMSAQIEDDWEFRTGIVVEKMPTFAGGDEALIKYITTSAIYPESSRNKSIKGRVYVDFNVDKEGKVSDLKILKGLNSELDSVALNIIREMPDWIPAEQRGKTVAMRYRLPITFNNDFKITPPKPSMYWKKKGKRKFTKLCIKNYGLNNEEIDCWYNFIIWNYNYLRLKDIDIELMINRQKCK